MNGDLKKAFMWGAGLALGFMVVGTLTGTIKRL